MPVIEPTLTIVPPVPCSRKWHMDRPHRTRDVAEVEVEHQVPVLVGRLVNAGGRNEGQLPAHDRDQDVEPAELAGRVRHELVERAGRSHVRGEGDGISQFRGGLVGSLRIAIGHGDRASRRAEPPRDRPADAAATAADHEAFLALEHSAAKARRSAAGRP